MKKEKVIEVIPTFREVYLPLELYWGKTFCNGHMVFDFANKMFFKNSADVLEETQKIIVDILNSIPNTKEFKIPSDLISEDGVIYIFDAEDNKREFVVIRGWGYLTGTGGLHLKDTDAIKIQDDFAEYIIETLRPYIKIT